MAVRAMRPQGLMAMTACLVALTALAGCGGPLVAPELMAKPRITEAQLQAMDDEALKQQRSDIDQQRERAGSAFRQAQLQCWKRFAVNRCIDQAAQVRRASLDQLSADEVVVQDEMRKRRLQRADARLQGKQGESDE